jgi:hypothetical protein
MICRNCGHLDGEHDERECRGGEDIICRCPGFVSEEEEEDDWN